MKRMTLIVLVLFVVVVLSALAQTAVDLGEYKTAVEDFGGEFAKSLPMNSMIGLNWSDAYIGQLLDVPPHFGVGLTMGFTTIPVAAFEDLLKAVDTEVPGDLAGIPLPAYAFDARVGGFFIPFDLGVKFGTVPEIEIGDTSVEWNLIGVDVRYALLDGGVLPKLSVGVGYNRLSGTVSSKAGLDDIPVGSVPYDQDGDGASEGSADVVLADPAFFMDWSANVFDFKAQVSKGLLVIEPTIGLGMSIASAGLDAGFEGTVDVQTGGVSAADLVSSAGVDVAPTGLTVSSDESPIAFRVFGGTSINLALLRFDIGLMYNINSGAFGASLGSRIQL